MLILKKIIYYCIALPVGLSLFPFSFLGAIFNIEYLFIIPLIIYMRITDFLIDKLGVYYDL